MSDTYCNLSNMFLSFFLYIPRYEALSAESLINNLWKCSLRGDSYKCIFWFTLQTFVWWKIQNLYVWWNICPQFLKCKHCLEFNFIWWPRSGLWIPNIEVWIRLIAFLIGIAQAQNIYFVWKKKDLMRELGEGNMIGEPPVQKNWMAVCLQFRWK